MAYGDGTDALIGADDNDIAGASPGHSKLLDISSHGRASPWELRLFCQNLGGIRSTRRESSAFADLYGHVKTEAPLINGMIDQTMEIGPVVGGGRP